MSNETRRAHDRIDASFNVSVSFAGKHIDARCVNISQGGMFLSVDEQIPIGEVITAEFRLPDHPQMISAEARICWSEREERQGIGVKFIGLRAIEVWAINQLFRRKSRGDM
jgi:c-di-GMP-binding flagellar brake protein YcgR